MTTDKGRIWPAEWADETDLKTGVHIKRLTGYRGNSHHLYFTNPGWFADGTKLLFGSDRENKTNLFSLDLQGGEITQLTDYELLPRPYEIRFQRTCVNPTRDEAYFIHGRDIVALDLSTLEERILGQVTEGFVPSMLNCTADGAAVCLGEYQDLSGRIRMDLTRGYVGFRENHDAHPRSRIVTIVVDDGTRTVVWEEDYWIGHVNTSPTQADILTFCHEGPWHVVDNRIWGMRISEGTPWQIRPRVGEEAVGHEYWYADGVHLGYHGWYPDAHAVFGRVTFDGTGNVETPCTEQTGHTHSNDDALIVGDGGKAVRLWKKQGDTYAQPRMLVEHNSSFKIQEVHVHPRFTPDGSKVLYTSDWTGYGQVYLADLVDVEKLPVIEDGE